MTVTSDLHYAVVLRDGQCVIAALDASHTCRDQWGDPHPPTAIHKLTLGHVREHAGGQRRDEPGWCIAQCAESNLEHDESRLASEVRAYLIAMRRVGTRHE